MQAEAPQDHSITATSSIHQRPYSTLVDHRKDQSMKKQTRAARDNRNISNLFHNYIEKISATLLFDLNFQLIWSHQNLISLANHKMRPWTEIWWNQSTKLEIRLALMKSINNQPHEFGHTLTRKFHAWHSSGCPKKGDFQNAAGATMHRLNHQ